MALPTEIVVVGGTGMLRPAVHDLLRQGVRIVLVARRPGRVATGPDSAGTLVPIAADWAAPEVLAERVRAAMHDRRVQAAILWVHGPHASGLHAALRPILSEDATVVQLVGSASKDPRRLGNGSPPYVPPRSYRRVILGFADGPAGTRWLTDAEISDGALRALVDPSDEQVVGRVEPWSDRP